MPKSSKPKRKYTPNRTINRAASMMERVIAKMPMRPDAARDIEIAAHIALDRLMNGGDKDSLYILATALDVSHELAIKGVGAEYKADIEAGMAALVRAKKHGDRVGVWVLVGRDAKAVQTALATHDAQIEDAPRWIVVETIKAVTARIETGSNETEFEQMLLEAA